MSDIQILVVEDEPDGADVVGRMLRSVGVSATIAPHAEAALEYLAAAPVNFTAAIIDLALPEMDGIELMQTIRSMPAVANMPLIAMTAFHTPELKAKSLDNGFDAYFAKPLDSTLFVQTLERLLG